MMDIGVIVGNPKKGSRTMTAAMNVAECLAPSGPTTVIDVIDLGSDVLGWGAASVTGALEKIQGCNVLIVASPTFKATYSGILKLFLDNVPRNGLSNQVAIPVMVGASSAHSLAPELTLKPLLVELGATCPTRSLFVLEESVTDRHAFREWLDESIPRINRALGVERPPPSVLEDSTTQRGDT